MCGSARHILEKNIAPQRHYALMEPHWLHSQLTNCSEFLCYGTVKIRDIKKLQHFLKPSLFQIFRIGDEVPKKNVHKPQALKWPFVKFWNLAPFTNEFFLVPHHFIVKTVHQFFKLARPFSHSHSLTLLAWFGLKFFWRVFEVDWILMNPFSIIKKIRMSLKQCLEVFGFC